MIKSYYTLIAAHAKATNYVPQAARAVAEYYAARAEDLKSLADSESTAYVSLPIVTVDDDGNTLARLVALSGAALDQAEDTVTVVQPDGTTTDVPVDVVDAALSENVESAQAHSVFYSVSADSLEQGNDIALPDVQALLVAQTGRLGPTGALLLSQLSASGCDPVAALSAVNTLDAAESVLVSVDDLLLNPADFSTTSGWAAGFAAIGNTLQVIWNGVRTAFSTLGKLLANLGAALGSLISGVLRQFAPGLLGSYSISSKPRNGCLEWPIAHFRIPLRYQELYSLLDGKQSMDGRCRNDSPATLRAAEYDSARGAITAKLNDHGSLCIYDPIYTIWVTKDDDYHCRAYVFVRDTSYLLPYAYSLSTGSDRGFANSFGSDFDSFFNVNEQQEWSPNVQSYNLVPNVVIADNSSDEERLGGIYRWIAESISQLNYQPMPVSGGSIISPVDGSIFPSEKNGFPQVNTGLPAELIENLTLMSLDSPVQVSDLFDVTGARYKPMAGKNAAATLFSYVTCAILMCFPEGRPWIQSALTPINGANWVADVAARQTDLFYAYSTELSTDWRVKLITDDARAATYAGIIIAIFMATVASAVALGKVRRRRRIRNNAFKREAQMLSARSKYLADPSPANYKAYRKANKKNVRAQRRLASLGGGDYTAATNSSLDHTDELLNVIRTLIVGEAP